ncbi:YdcF family protein [Roseomonas sp. HF4]|uniref:YdcF family protein n=1 Tax=Roseomonas sp. HF4 TaxID=2562313 RepID=UPI0010C042E1|nr:YdcF family protein [Roseomonas sp. HF4]
MTGRLPPFLGHDGAITLVAALFAAALSLGLAPLVAAVAVRRMAAGAATLPARPPARILVLGHRLDGRAPSAAFVARLARAKALAGGFPAARIVLLGGAARPGAPVEAEIGRAWLAARGIDPARIEAETRSRHTLENLANHRGIGHPPGPEALVTSRLHLHRALLMARGLGLSPDPVAAEDALRPDLPRLVLEGFLVHWYLTGRFLARILRRRPWLARIG